MVKGIGVDMTEIYRIERLMENRRFLERFFSGGERAMFAQKGNAPESVAANFAAKEAFSKALGTGVRGFRLKDVEVLRDQSGKPYITLYGEAKHIAETLGINDLMVSLSHAEEYAVAFVVAQ